jgi:predicted enzyme related to lactoylglutathione lyase
VVAAVERLTAAGACVIREDVLQGRPDHVVMADPEGNEFCVV